MTKIGFFRLDVLGIVGDENSVRLTCEINILSRCCCCCRFQDMAGYGWMLLDIPPYLSPLSVEVSELSSRGSETVSDEAEVKFWLLVMLFRALKSVTGLRREGEAVGVL